MQPRSRVTIRDVAARAGVSVATVSKVINQRYGVAADTFARVRAVIDELGYEASLVAQSLRNHKTNVIGILVADLEPFSTELLKGAADAIRGTGFELVVYSAGGRTGDPEGWERRYLSRLSGTLVDGAVLVTPAAELEGLPGTPVVAVDPHTGRSPLPAIVSDNLRGAQLATEHLLALGHRRIALLAGRPDLQSAQLRETGYRRALATAGVEVDETLVVAGDYDGELAAASARELLTRPDRPTAVFAANDTSAIATLEAASALGLRVPDDVSVVGFDNIPESALCTPPLTTVEQPIREMGHRAITVLIGLINGGTEEREPVVLDTKLVVRSSSAAPRARS
ncbi:LacI family DNA-binding transcriptional regulator [Amycolatopsis sp. NPDC051903]|uniref:LacI family DNA-binding transcriptional regulator n=1 Tax=Amycolatopsis sp. NPDC051903 TaxID=3363936 RepID=UPI00379F8C2C